MLEDDPTQRRDGRKRSSGGLALVLAIGALAVVVSELAGVAGACGAVAGVAIVYLLVTAVRSRHGEGE